MQRIWGLEMKHNERIEGIIESLLFMSGDLLSSDTIAEILELDKKSVKQIINEMKEKYKSENRGINIREINDSYQFYTKPEYSNYVNKLFEPRQKQVLSQAAYETLAIVAYNRPITKARIDDIRGVNSDSSIASLMERNLIREAGRVDSPGRPILYETTEEFLRCFGFSSHEDLPLLDHFSNIESSIESSIEPNIEPNIESGKNF